MSMEMMKNMPPEQMEQMSEMMGGAVKKEDLAKMQKMMSDMTPEQMEQYTRY